MKQEQTQNQDGWKYHTSDMEPISASLLEWYEEQRGFHHPMANMLARGAVLTSRSHEGVNSDLNDLQE